MSATLRLRPASGETVAVTTFEAELVDVASQRLASPQAFSAPAVPFSVPPAGSDVGLSFLTRPGAEPFGGTVQAVLTGTDSHGEQWTAAVRAPVIVR